MAISRNLATAVTCGARLMGGNIHSMKLGNHIESSHRLLRDDVATEDHNYSFLYQLTHITCDRGSLTHDDRVDAVAGAVAHFQRAMMMNVDQAAKAMRDEEMLEEIEDFLEGFNQPTYRGMRRC